MDMFQNFTAVFMVLVTGTVVISINHQQRHGSQMTQKTPSTYYTLSANQNSEYISQKDRIDVQDAVLDYLGCARFFRAGLWVIQYKYLDFTFVQHFKQLKITVIRTVSYPQKVRPDLWRDDCYGLQGTRSSDKYESLSTNDRLPALVTH